VEIRPYPIIHYPFEEKLLSQVVCPPYDKVSDEMISSFRATHPHNFIHAILGKTLHDPDYYPEATATIRRWVKEGVLVSESEDQILILRQKFRSPLDGEMCHRAGFFALLRLPERDRQEVLPHERTFADHKADRLKLYQTLQGNPEAIFILYSDPDSVTDSILRSVPAEVTFRDYIENENELCRLQDPEVIAQLRAIVESRHLLIADGHHRFETGMDYRDEMRSRHPEATGPQPYDYILVYFTPMESPGLVILPTHRLVRNLSEQTLARFLEKATPYFEIKSLPLAVNAESIRKLLSAVHHTDSGHDSIGLVTREHRYELVVKDRAALESLLPADMEQCLKGLPVVWLHRILFDQWLSLHQEEGAPQQVEFAQTVVDVSSGLFERGFDAGFLLRGTRPDEVRLVAESGCRMPQKSTDFYPKILSGLTLYLHEV
jgi:uncharacterized protein (DUF1015 family)